MKVYLGDGAYMEMAHRGLTGDAQPDIILTAENGVEVTERIVLEPEVLHAMITHLKSWGLA